MQLTAVFRLFAFTLASAGWLTPQTRKAITVDDAARYSPPTPITPVWAPDGKSFAYEQNGAVYVFDIGERNSREWLRLADLQTLAKTIREPGKFDWQNRRVSSETYQWFPNGKALLAAV